jgi:hypothetical protein
MQEQRSPSEIMEEIYKTILKITEYEIKKIKLLNEYGNATIKNKFLPTETIESLDG